LAAIAMVVVAAIAMSSATFAWFVNNAQVTATNVNVQASTAYSLLISHDKTAWGTTTKLTKDLTTLTPVSTIGEVMEDANGLTLAAADTTKQTSAVGIGDDSTVELGDVRFVTNTAWGENRITAVSEVSKTSTVGATSSSSKISNTYFYRETVYLKAAQQGSVYLDSTGIGIAWNNWDTESSTTSGTPTFFTLAQFMGDDKTGNQIVEPGEALTSNDAEVKSAAEQYMADLTSARALLKTLRVGLLVTTTEGEETNRRQLRQHDECVQ
jgi:hypothetical protein